MTLKHIGFNIHNLSISPRSARHENSLAQETAICAGIECAPGSETLFPKKLRREIDVGFTVEQIAKIQARAFEVNSVDLEIAPVQGSVGVVVIDLALALRVFGALDSKRHTAIGAQLPAGISCQAERRRPC